MGEKELTFSNKTKKHQINIVTININNFLVSCGLWSWWHILIYSVGISKENHKKRKLRQTIKKSICWHKFSHIIDFFHQRAILFKMRKWNDKFAWFRNIVSIKHLSDGRFKACIINATEKKKLHDICLWYHLLFSMLKIIHVN